jgi:hypothetical protein
MLSLNWRARWRNVARSVLASKLDRTYVLWSGPSALDGAPIMVVASCVSEPSDNGKTGDMIQLAIMRADLSPSDAWRVGADGAVCPDACAHRSKERGGDGTCYVNKARLSDAWAAGVRLVNAGRVGYPAGLFRGARVRFGMEGDPSAVPLEVWRPILADSGAAHTGYTAAWRSLPVEWSRYFMASVSSPADYIRARSTGWRPFAGSASVTDDAAYVAAGATLCEAERPTPSACVSCLQCNGARTGDARPGRYLPLHGAVGATVRKRNNRRAVA